MQCLCVCVCVCVCVCDAVLSFKHVNSGKVNVLQQLSTDVSEVSCGNGQYSL